MNPWFDYTAIDTDGRLRQGRRQAADPAELQRWLLARRWLVQQVQPSAPAATGGRAGRFGSRDLALFTRQLSALSASLPLEQALQTIAAQASKRAVRQTITAVQEQLAQGLRLSEAMASAGPVFPPLYRAMVAAGEAAGALPAVLERLAGLLENQQAMRSRLITALAYPAALALTAIGVVIALLTLVVPRVVEQFDSMGRQLPLLTRLVVGTAEGLTSAAPWLLAGILLATPLALWQWRNAAVRQRIDSAVLALPWVGRLLREVHAAQLARTLAIMLGAGLPLMEGLRAAARTVANRHLRQRTEDMAQAIAHGGSLGAAMRRAAVFPPTLLHLTASGEESGRLAPMLESAADYLERELATFTQVAMSLLEPLIIVVLGGVVALIVLAILLPILQFNSLVLG